MNLKKSAKSKRWSVIFTRVILIIAALAFVIKFAGPNLLRQYISFGIGDCKSSPVLCRQPEEKVFTPTIDQEYRQTLIPHVFPKVSLSAPKGFALVQELIKKPYYKKRQAKHKAVIYLLIQEPQAFIKLYPDVQKVGVNDNAEFIRRLESADLSKVESISDAFFLIMKSVFTPDIGNQSTAKMITFKLDSLNGYINYSMSRPNNYFDCNVLDADGNFFKLYIKDIGAQLDLNNVFAIISTLKPVN